MSNRIPRRRVLAGSALLGTAALAGPPSREVAADAETVTRAAEPTESTDSIEPTSAPRSGGLNQETSAIELENLESFVDDRMGSLLADRDVVGASVAVVHDGAVELAKGYGHADADESRPVAADETAFRIGSVSKPLVWTAVMQLIEDGRIDPHEPVDTYLESVSIPEAYDEPITIAHLATHTAGFEERFRGTWVTDPDELRPLPEVLREERPERVRPPGEIASYSNYGAALAGQVVADVTGVPFAEYVAENVFDPLGMDRTTFDQPVPGNIGVANGYTTATGSVRESPDLFLEIAPAGAATATATDMARFLRAHLEGGTVDGDRILEAETVDGMHAQWFTHHDALSGVAFGLLEDERDGVRVLEHDGAIPGSFNSQLLLVPEYDLGLFLATNTDGGRAALGEFVEDFLEEYLPDAGSGGDSPLPDPDGPPERAAALEGTYRGVQIAESTHARLSSTLQAGSVDVAVDEDGYLVTDFGGAPTRWVERADEPLVFDEVDGDDALAFRERNGEITHLFRGFFAFERLSWHESLAIHGGFAGATTLGMLSGAIGWPLARGWRRFRGDSSDGDPTADEPLDGERADGGESTPSRRSSAKTAVSESASGRGRLSMSLAPSRVRWIAGAAVACLFGFVAGFVALLAAAPYTLLSRPPFAYDVVSLLPVLGALATAAAAGCAVVAWREGYWGRLSRIHYTLVVASAVGFCWLLYYWNFLRLPL